MQGHTSRPVAAALAFGLWAMTMAAHANGGRLVLIGPDPSLAHAAEVALEPWGLDVQPMVAHSPGATLPRSAERARVLADAQGATALAWVSATEDGHALWVYERRGDRVVAQPVASGPPYDDAQAAALALTLKALLRHSLAAPAKERFGATDEAAAEPGWSGHVALGAAAGVRAFELAGGSAEARLWLSAAVLWPALGGALGPLLEANLGLGGVQADEPMARTTLHAHALGLGAAWRWPVGARFDLGAATLATLRLSRLSGELTSPASAVDLRRANPTLAARLEAGLPLGRSRLSLRVGIDVPLRTQRYLVDGGDLASTGPVALEAGLGMEVYLPSGRH